MQSLTLELVPGYTPAQELEDARLTRRACLAEGDKESAKWWFNESRKIQTQITNDRRLHWLRSQKAS